MQKVLIQYNSILDEMAKAHALNSPKLGEKAAQKTDMEFVNARITEYRNIWRKINDQVFTTIEKMTGKPFLNGWVMVNVVWVSRFTESGGMIFPVTHDPDNFVITLSHELMHNSGGVFTNEFKEKYKDETLQARTHIVINAMTEHLWRDVLGKPEYVDRHKERCKENKAVDHLRAWEIIEKEGYMHIVENYLQK